MGGVTCVFFPFSSCRRGTIGVGCRQQVSAGAWVINGNVNELGEARGPIDTEVQNGSNAGGAPAGFGNFGEDLNAAPGLEEGTEEVPLRMVAAPDANKGVVPRGVQNGTR